MNNNGLAKCLVLIDHTTYVCAKDNPLLHSYTGEGTCFIEMIAISLFMNLTFADFIADSTFHHCAVCALLCSNKHLEVLILPDHMSSGIAEELNNSVKAMSRYTCLLIACSLAVYHIVAIPPCMLTKIWG